MSVDKASSVNKYEMCDDCQQSVPRTELVDGECVYCVYDLPNPTWE